MERVAIAGPNFSGRSDALRARLGADGKSFFLGPYAEAALSGLSSTVADEIAIYRADARRHAMFPADIATAGMRKPATLSGGEQVLLALHCFSQSDYGAIGIDTALEQLDVANRALALDYLAAGAFDVTLADNRVEQAPAGWSRQDTARTPDGFSLDLEGIAGALKPRAAPAIAISDMDFSYPAKDIFRGVDLSLAPATIYRLIGDNGAGKTTLLKLLVGVLAPSRGTISLDGTPYEPRRNGNRAFALATQNPDHQWCGATLREDVARRRNALSGRGIALPSEEKFAALSGRLGAKSLDDHVYELPLVARKRLSWLWPFCGAMPWAMLDEPTIGQDRDTRIALAAAVTRLGALGYGVLFVTHDDDFAARVTHRVLRIGGGTIREE
jgi:energy-coupling factor transporter ATP-binding protein EcfA2